MNGKQTTEKLAVLSLSLMLTSAYAVSTVLPQMLGFFDGYRRDQVELLISVPSFAVTAMIILNAWLARLLRERMAIVTGLLLLTLGGIAPVFTSSYWLIFGSRILLGTGIGMINARAISIISERYQGQEKSALLGYRGSAEVLGNALMTLVAGQLLKIRWNAAFWVYALGFGILVLYLLFVPVKVPAEISHAEETEIRQKSFSGREFLFTLPYALLGFTVICINVSNTMRIPTLVLEKQFTTESGASVILSVMLAMGIFSGLSFGRLQKLFREKLTAISMLLVGLGLLLIALAGNLALVVAGAVLCGFFYTVVLTCIFNTVSDRLPLALVNTATSEVLVGCNLGAALAPVVLRVIGFCSGASVAPFFAYAVAAAIIGGILFMKRG